MRNRPSLRPVSGTTAPLSDLALTAHALADLSAVATLKQFRRRFTVANKASTGFDPVTSADTAAEKVMRRELARRHPDHGIVGEEFDEKAGAGRFRWVLDPIDGTRAFMVGFPVWGTLIGLVDGDTPLLGLMDQPFTGERFIGVRGHGTRLSIRGAKPAKLGVSACTSLADARLSATTPEMFRGSDERSFQALAARVRVTRYGGDCYAYCMLAAGHLDLVVEAGLKAVDIVPLIAIIEGAGGRVTTWDGGSPLSGGRIIAAATAELHQAATRVLTA